MEMKQKVPNEARGIYYKMTLRLKIRDENEKINEIKH